MTSPPPPPPDCIPERQAQTLVSIPQDRTNMVGGGAWLEDVMKAVGWGGGGGWTFYNNSGTADGSPDRSIPPCQ